MSRVNVVLHDLVTTILDTIDAHSDPAERLAAYQFLDKQYEQRIIANRDRTAYEARSEVKADVLADKCGVRAATIYYWADRHRVRSGAPKVVVKRRPGIDTATDLAARGD